MEGAEEGAEAGTGAGTGVAAGAWTALQPEGGTGAANIVISSGSSSVVVGGAPSEGGSGDGGCDAVDAVEALVEAFVAEEQGEEKERSDAVEAFVKAEEHAGAFGGSHT